MRTLVVLCAAGVLLASWCGSASAKLVHPFVTSFGSFGNVQGVAIDQSSGDMYVYDGGEGEVLKFDASGSPVNFTSTGTNAISGVGSAGNDEGEIAVDSSSGPAKGDIYVAHADGSVNIYSAAGAKLGELTEGGHPWGEACGVAVDASGNVYVGLWSEHVNKYVPSANPVTNADYAASMGGMNGMCNIAVDSAGNVFSDRWPEGPVARYEPGQLGSLSATGSVVDSAGSTLAVDPASDEVYIDERGQVSQFGAHGLPFEQPKLVFAASGEGAVSGSLGIAVSGFNHDVYVSDGKGGVSVFGPLVFIAKPPVVEEEHAANVAATSATLGARLNAEESDTTYRFEYGPTASYGSSTPEVDAGATGAFQSVQAHLQGLLPSTTYHYRLVASSSVGPTEGPDLTFTTQEAGGSLTLLDGRQWEVVSPQDKHGAGIEPKPFEGGLIQAAEDGNGISYLASNAIEGEPEGNRPPEPIQILAKRVPGGWSNKTIATPNEEIHGLPVGYGSEYRMFSPDLSLAVLEPHSTTTLAPSATERTQYVRDEAACEAALPGCFTPFVTPEDTQPGVKWDPNPSYVYSEAKFVSASSDLRHVVLHAKVALTSGAAEEGLYEWSGGHLQFVSILPQGEGGTPVDGSLGNGNLTMRSAISRDGSRIVFGAGGLYMRDTARGETLRLDPAEGSTPTFQIATRDDSRVFFTEGNSVGTSLYECDIVEAAGKLACNLSQVAGGDVQGMVLGASEDGTSVYFAANGVLAAGAEPGGCGSSGATCNLYVAQLKGSEWSVRFVAGLAAGFSDGDFNDWHAGTPSLLFQTSRVSSDGRFLAFMSNRSLTGYDNRDAASGEPDEEVFLYDAASQKLTCASCDPTGARPSGRFDEGGLAPPLVDPEELWSGRWLAASIPGWSNIDLQVAHYQPRYLSDSGRLFFDSSDALVPQDTNGLQDVYEYEPEGAGSCSRAGGCVDLISSGASGEEAVFLDASASGDDAFFITSARLVSQDQDTAFDVYDAHVCSASVPCVQQPVSPPPCSTGDACKAAPSPQPAIFGAPSSATYSGMGNAVPPAVKPKPRRAALTRAQKLARALRACAKRPKRARAACRGRARAKYAKASVLRSGRRGRSARTSRDGNGGHNGRGR